MKKLFYKLPALIFLSLFFIILNFFSSLNAPNSNQQVAKAIHKTKQLSERPTIVSHYSIEQPASLKPFLQWNKVAGAVAYEIEFLYTPAKYSEYPEIAPNCFFNSKYVYVNGFNANFTENLPATEFYWRVRALDIAGNPLSLFSDSEKIYVDKNFEPILKPQTTAVFNAGQGTTLLYPVYAWIPIAGAEKYEIEVLDSLPENPNGIEPSEHRLDALIAVGSDCYDTKPRFSTKPFYWRVRGLDHDDNPVGVYSDVASFLVNPEQNISVATYGDSITHGGGSVSYSPVDWEYSYQSYLNFPTINLAKSGDTSQTMVERFDDDVLPFQPKYLVILAGTNSIRGGASASEVIVDLRTLKEKCLAHNILPIFLTLPPVNPKNIQKIFNEPTAPDWQFQRRLVNDYIRSQVHIDITKSMENLNGDLKNKLAVDGLHLDIVGKKRIAQAINENWSKILNLPWYTWLKNN